MLGYGIDIVHQLIVVKHRWLSLHAFEVTFCRPEIMPFSAGQKIMLTKDKHQREYSLINGVDDDEIVICVRLVKDGIFSPLLARAKPGDQFSASQPYGFFTYQPPKNRTVFIATGTGIAPFVSFVRSGAKDYILLHGVRTESELYYQPLLAKNAREYIPCLSKPDHEKAVGENVFNGWVTEYLKVHLKNEIIDFYLCGNGKMIKDAISIIDNDFPDSHVFTELYYS